MTIPAATTNQTAQREPFRQLRALMNQLSDSLPQLDTLSMGMSGDLEAAVSGREHRSCRHRYFWGAV